MRRTADKITKPWIRNKSDELAVRNGCWFNVRRAAYAVWWIERYCRLYEGESAGNPLALVGCHKCRQTPVEGEWFLEDGETEDEKFIARCIARAEKHNRCVAAGHNIDWQYDCIMRLFGWVRHSKKWGRAVRRFRKASIWVAKKNKKSPTLAAVCLYLLCGDGEPGQKVFLGAKDGRQAKEIAGKHAVEMIRKSPELEADCTINLTHLSITHEPTRSIMCPLSSSNERTQESKEGLNGSVMIDETHVVDREFINRISRAGISRPEPLQAEFSTAGNNPDGYGRSRFDRAIRVIDGSIEEQGLFAAVYAAPQDLNDDDLEADPLKYGRMANPALGHTIDPEEFLEDYKTSKAGSIDDFATYKMYRLNIWQRASNPWIRESTWQKCGKSYKLEDLFGLICYPGLDLSKIRDTTALVLLFPPQAGYEAWRMWPFFWLPEDTVRSIADKVPFRDWQKRGDIEFTPGDWIDYEAVRAKLNWCLDKFDLQKLSYDIKFASELIGVLSREDGWAIEQFNPFPQTDMMFAAPTSEFELLLTSGKLHHPKNAVLDWQAGHVVAPENPRTKIKRAQRPKRGDHRTVDGIIAAIMGLGHAMTRTETETRDYYDNHEVEFV